MRKGAGVRRWRKRTSQNIEHVKALLLTKLSTD
jgi:hypothetical protein